jgi:hypothetical protein
MKPTLLNSRVKNARGAIFVKNSAFEAANKGKYVQNTKGSARQNYSDGTQRRTLFKVHLFY